MLLLLLLPETAAAESAVAGVTIGMPIRSVALALGPPEHVASSDAGNQFVFRDGTTAYTDDDGIVLAVDIPTGSPRIDVDGSTRTFAIGSYPADRADAELAGVAEFATPTRKSYRLSPRRDLVLEFGSASQRLDRVTYGEPGQLARLGLLPGDAATKAVVYRAPQPRAALAPPANGERGAVVYRLAVDRFGNVTGVDVAIPAPIATDSADADAEQRLRATRFVPALLDGRPIAATVFVASPP